MPASSTGPSSGPAALAFRDVGRRRRIPDLMVHVPDGSTKMNLMIQLTDDVRDRLASALADRCPVVAASVDDQGQPHLSFYGTTQVYGPSQLAIWVRDPASSFLQRLAKNPRVCFLYRNAAERVMYQFQGRGRPVPEEDVRQEVFDHSPEVEQAMDPGRRGVAVLIDLDHVKGRVEGEAVEMHG